MAAIGFVGLGNMGGPMAAHLIKAGHKLRVFDLSQPAVAKLVEAGVEAASSASDAANGVEAVITMLPAGQHVRDIYIGPRGLIASAPRGCLLIDCSTIDVATAREIARRCRSRRVRYARRASLGRGRRRASRNTYVHGGRKRERFQTRRAYPVLDGQDGHPCRGAGQWPSREDLQQYDPRHFDDCGVGSVRAWRETRTRATRPFSTSPRSHRANAGRLPAIVPSPDQCLPRLRTEIMPQGSPPR